MKNLSARLRRTGFLFLVGIFLIIYVGLGFLYFQQAPQQKKLNEQIIQQSIVAAKPLPVADKLQAEANEVKIALAPLTDYAVLEKLVTIARESGINVERAAGKFTVPAASKVTDVTVGSGKYQVLPVKNIKVQGSYEDVMRFVADLDVGRTLPTMVLRRAAISKIELPLASQDPSRAQELLDVQAAVGALMEANGLETLPYPRDFAGEVAFNDMTVFPDAASDWIGDRAGKLVDSLGLSYMDGDKPGYLLIGNDIIADGQQTNLADYFKIKKTKFFYTCEANGLVRQFNASILLGAMEYHFNLTPTFETQATVDVDVYYKVETKPITPTVQPKPTTTGAK